MVNIIEIAANANPLIDLNTSSTSDIANWLDSITDWLPHFNAAKIALPFGGIIQFPTGSEYYGSSNIITYSFSSSLILDKPLTLQGEGMQYGATGLSASKFEFLDSFVGNYGIVVTSTSIISQIFVEGAGIKIDATATLRNVSISLAPKHGIYVTVNAQNWQIEYCSSYKAGTAEEGHGLYVKGKAGVSISFDARACSGYAIFDDGLYGNTYIGSHASGNGFGYKSVRKSVFICSYIEGSHGESEILNDSMWLGGHRDAPTGNGTLIERNYFTIRDGNNGIHFLNKNKVAGETEPNNIVDFTAGSGEAGCIYEFGAKNDFSLDNVGSGIQRLQEKYNLTPKQVALCHDLHKLYVSFLKENKKLSLLYMQLELADRGDEKAKLQKDIAEKQKYIKLLNLNIKQLEDQIDLKDEIIDGLKLQGRWKLRYNYDTSSDTYGWYAFDYAKLPNRDEAIAFSGKNVAPTVDERPINGGELWFPKGFYLGKTTNLIQIKSGTAAPNTGYKGDLIFNSEPELSSIPNDPNIAGWICITSQTSENTTDAVWKEYTMF